MLLLESLTGIAELECEHIPLEKVNCIENILSALRAPVSERSLYLKRLYLQEWENVSRQMNESVRSYVNRYRRVVQDLQSMQIGLEAAFSSEAWAIDFSSGASSAPTSSESHSSEASRASTTSWCERACCFSFLKARHHLHSLEPRVPSSLRGHRKATRKAKELAATAKARGPGPPTLPKRTPARTKPPTRSTTTQTAKTRTRTTRKSRPWPPSSRP